jgi:zinc transporter 1/2/3
LSGDKNDIALLVKAVVMEIAIAMHSIVIGVAFGALGDVTELVGLLVALSFHQLFEGIALGAALQSARAQLGERKVWTFALTFAVTTPIGILIGLFALPTDEAPSDNQEYAQGILNAIAAGNLIYIALVEMVSEDFRSPLAAKSGNLRAAMIVALLAGDLCLAILAIWA